MGGAPGFGGEIGGGCTLFGRAKAPRRPGAPPRGPAPAPAGGAAAATAGGRAREAGGVRALVFESFGGPLGVREVPDPAPAPDGVVVRVAAGGLCRSDWHAWQGPDPDVVLPHVPGHELAGTVAAVGAGVRRWTVGGWGAL